MYSTATPTVSNYSSIVPINPNMDQFSNIEKLNLNDLTEEYIDIYVPLEVIEGNSIKNINLNYDLSEPSANDLIILNADEYIKNSNFNIKITFSDKVDPNGEDRSELKEIHTINKNIVLTKEYLSIEKYNNIYKISISNKYFIKEGIELNKYIIQPKQNNEYDMSCYFDTSKERVEDHEFIILAEDNRNIYEVIDNILYISLDIELEEDIANINHKNINVAINLLNKIKKPILNYTYKYNYPFEDDIQIEIINNRLYFYISEIYIKDIFNRNLSDLLLSENNLAYELNLGSAIIYYDVKINLLKKRFEIIIDNYKNLRDVLLYYTGDISFKIDIYDTELYNIDITNLNYNISLKVDNVNYNFNSIADNIIVRSDSYSTIIINILNTDFYNKCNVNLKDTIIKNSNNKNFNYHINNQFNFNGKIEDALEIRYNDTFESLYINANLYNTETDKIEFKDINLVVNNKYKFLSKISQQITVELCNLTKETEYNKITASDKTYNFQYINNKKDDIEFEISDDNILLCINGEIFEKAFNTKLEHFSHIIPSKKFISLSGVTNSNYYNETTSTGTTSSSSTSTDTTSAPNTLQPRSAFVQSRTGTTTTRKNNVSVQCKTVYTINTIKNRIEILCDIPNNVSFSSNQSISVDCKIISKYDKIIYNDIKPSEYNYKINVYIDGKLYSITDPSDIDFSQDSNNSIILNITGDVLKKKCDGIDLSNYIHYDPYPNTNKIYDYFIDSEYFDSHKKQPSLEIRYDDISKLFVTGENVINIYFTKLKTNIDDYIFNVNVNLKYLEGDDKNKVETNSFKFIKGQYDEVEFELNSTKTKLLLSIHESYFNKAFGFDLSDCIVDPIELKGTNVTGNSSTSTPDLLTTSTPNLSSTLVPSELSVNYGVQYNAYKNRIEILYNVADIRVIDNYDNNIDKTINATVNCTIKNETAKKLHTPANEFKYKVNVYLQSLDNINNTVAQHTFTFDSKEFANNITVSSDETNKPVLYIEGRVFNKIAQRDLSELVEVTLTNTTQNTNYNAFINNSYVDASGELTDAIEIRYNIDTTELELSVYNVCDIYLQECKVLTKLKYNINIIEYKNENCDVVYKQYSFVHIKGHRDEVEFEINEKHQVILSILNHNFIKVFDSSIDNYKIITNVVNDVSGSSTLSPNTTTASSPNTAITSSTTAEPFTYSSDVNIFKDRLEIVCPNINSIDEDKNGSVNITVHIVRKDYATYKYGESIYNYKYQVIIQDIKDDKNTEHIFNYINDNNTGGIKLFEDDNSKGTIVITNDIFKKKIGKNIDDFIIVPNENYAGYNVNYNLYSNSKGEYENAIEIELNDNYDLQKSERKFYVYLTNDSLNLDDYYYNIKVQEYDIFDNILGNPYIFKYEKGVRDEIEFMQTLNGDVILVISNNNFKKMFGYDIDDYGVFESSNNNYYEYDINKFKHQLEILVKDPKKNGIDNDSNSTDNSLNLEVNVYKREDVDREKIPLETIDNYYTINIYFDNVFIDGFTTNCIGNNKGSCFDLYYDENDNIEFKFDLCKAFNINSVNVYDNKELVIANIINISGSKIIKEHIDTELYKNSIGECIITGKFTTQNINESINDIYLCLSDKISESAVETHYIDLYIDGFYYDRLTNLKGFNLDYDTNKFTITNPKNDYLYVQTNDDKYINLIDLAFGEYITGYFKSGNNYGKMYLKTKGQLTKYKMITIPNPLHKIPIIKFDSDKKNEEIIVNKPKPTTTSSTSTVKPIEPILPTPTPIVTVSTTTSSTCTPEPITPTVTPDTTTSSSSTPKPTDVVTVTVSPEPVSPTVTPSVITKLYGYKIHSLGIERYNEYGTYNDALKAAKEYVDIYGQPSSSYPIYIYSPLYNRYDYALTYTKSSPTTTPKPIITPLLTAMLYYNNGRDNVLIKSYTLYSQNSNNTEISVTKYTNGNYNYLCKLNAAKDNFSISHKRITNVKLGGINITNYKFVGSIINIGLPKNYHGKTLYVYLDDGGDVASSTTSSSSVYPVTSTSTVTTGTPPTTRI